MIALYASAVSLLNLLFEIINASFRTRLTLATTIFRPNALVNRLAFDCLSFIYFPFVVYKQRFECQSA